MEQGFISTIQKMTTEQGAQVWLNGAWRKWLADYMKNQYQDETKLFKQILEAGCADFIESAKDVLERKRALLVRLEDDPGLGISPKRSAEYLDFLGMILKGDTSKCGAKPAPVLVVPQPVQPSPAVNIPAHSVQSAKQKTPSWFGIVRNSIVGVVADAFIGGLPVGLVGLGVSFVIGIGTGVFIVGGFVVGHNTTYDIVSWVGICFFLFFLFFVLFDFIDTDARFCVSLGVGIGFGIGISILGLSFGISALGFGIGISVLGVGLKIILGRKLGRE